jgi:transcription elongation factor Elf1
MPNDTIPVSFNCKQCGARITWSDDAVDSTAISCSNCGFHFGTYRDLRDTAIDAVRQRVEGLFRDTFKRR